MSEVDDEQIAEVLGNWTGIPVYKLTEEETTRLLRMEDELHKRVIGQQDAIKALSQAIRRTRAGLKDPKRPGGSFIFAGPSGVGKTELSKTLAEFLFGDEEAQKIEPAVSAARDEGLRVSGPFPADTAASRQALGPRYSGFTLIHTPGNRFRQQNMMIVASLS